MAKILGVRIDKVDFKEAMAKIAAFLMLDEFHQIATVNPEFLVAAQKDEKFKEILNQADLNVPDGVGLQLAAWFLGQKIGERITGVDLTWEICKLAVEKNYSIYLLGAAEGIAERTAQRLKLVYPNLKIAGFSSPEVSVDGSTDSQVIESINNSKADILLVALGAPKQEKFQAANRYQLSVKITMGVGGTFDYIAGVEPYAPVWIRKIGLEWFYRLLTQPKRWKRIFTAVVIFLYLVIKSRFKK